MTGAATTSGTAGGGAERRDWPADVRTLAIDVGGSGFKAAVLARDGTMLTERAKVETPYPCPPATFLTAISGLVGSLGVDYHRVSMGFPGLVRRGRVYHIPSLSRREYGGPAGPRADGGVARVRPRRCPDRGVLGAGQGRQRRRRAGLRGRPVATASSSSSPSAPAWAPHCSPQGVLLPHLELGHAQFRKGETFEEQLGNLARKEVGVERWSARLLKALDGYDRFLFYDHVYLGGGNSKHLDPAMLPAKATIVPNTAGILGGVRLWDMDLHI